MKNTKTEHDILERMRSGHITAQGFLGTDTRTLADIIEADAEEFRRLGLEPEAVADRLEYLRKEGGRGLGEPITVDRRWLVSAGDARGTLPCPWSDGIFHKDSVRVEDLKTGVVLVYSELSIHMLRAHGFCQGIGHTFRLSPGELAKFMGTR